ERLSGKRQGEAAGGEFAKSRGGWQTRSAPQAVAPRTVTPPKRASLPTCQPLGGPAEPPKIRFPHRLRGVRRRGGSKRPARRDPMSGDGVQSKTAAPL